MAATIQVHEMTTDADTGVDKTSSTVRFKDVPSTTSTSVDLNDPVPIPESGTGYSYVKKVRLYMEAPPDTNISNIRWYSGGSGYAAGIGVSVKNIGTTFGTHYNTAQSGGSDFFGYTSGSPLDGDGTDAGPFVPADDNSYIGDIIEFQLSVTSAVASGTLAQKTVTAAYDEI